MATFDPETLDRWRRLGPEVTYNEARRALYSLGASSSEDFLDAYEELVDRGLLSWEEIEQLGG
jgi:hypothetical protein